MLGVSPTHDVSIICLSCYFKQNIGNYFIHIAIDFNFDILHQNNRHVLCNCAKPIFLLLIQALSTFFVFFLLLLIEKQDSICVQQYF